MKRKRKSLFVDKILIISIIMSLVGCKNDNFCVVDNISLNKISPYYDGQWQGITVASDGSCYFGSSAHSMTHGGGFFRFNPQTNSVEVLAEDLTSLVGDDITKFTPQGKIHSPIIEIDGVLYMATHLAAYWEEVLSKYAGSYFLAYNTQTKEWTNYGIVKDGFSTYSAIEVDRKRGKAYFMTVPFAPKDTIMGNRLMEIDLKTKEKRDLGSLGKGKASFYFYLDDLGRLWASIWKGNGSLYCYDSVIGTIKEYENAFPEAKLMNNDNSSNYKPYFSEIAWTWAHPIDDNKKCLFTMGDFAGGDERLWMFNPHEDIESKKAFTPLCYIGNTFLSVALGGDRVYFIQRANNVESRNFNTEIMRDEPLDSNGYHISNLHLKSISLNPKYKYNIIDHGKLIDKQGRTAAYIGSMAADDKGNVYMSGSWTIKDNDQPTLQFIFKSSDGKEFGPLEGPNQEGSREQNIKTQSTESIIPLKRGEFFSSVNVHNDY